MLLLLHVCRFMTHNPKITTLQRLENIKGVKTYAMRCNKGLHLFDKMVSSFHLHSVWCFTSFPGGHGIVKERQTAHISAEWERLIIRQQESKTAVLPPLCGLCAHFYAEVKPHRISCQVWTDWMCLCQGDGQLVPGPGLTDSSQLVNANVTLVLQNAPFYSHFSFSYTLYDSKVYYLSCFREVFFLLLALLVW